MKKLRAAVIGAGYLGRFHARKYGELDGVELVGVADIDGERAAEVAAMTGAEPFEDYRDLLGRVDAVSIVTPTQTHYPIALDFLRNGVDVLVEKPMTVTVDEADRLIDEADRAGRVLQVGHLERFNGAVVSLEGRVDNPMFIESHRLSPFPDRGTDVDVVLDLMIHDIDIILNLVDSEVEWVDAVGVPVISTHVDIANARIRFGNGCVANVTASRISKERMRRIRLFQWDAYMAIDYASQHISVFRRTASGPDGPPTIAEEVLDIEKTDALAEEIRAFVRSCAEGTAPVVSGRDGRRALEVAVRIQESVRRSMTLLEEHIRKGGIPL
ncbi:MAG TPA: Gfo/Idh/MocA family oxidoreductase [Deltaproteobacteria bacterium]|nr:Gfo/Idh/MocA family oxidoreductase [Deltaproteobacteria bacterium]